MQKSIIFILLVFLFIQCQKEEAKSTQGKLDVFVGGTIAKNGHASPAYWKNDQEFTLPSGTEDSVSYSGVKSIGNYTNAVRVVDGSVYVGGAEVVNGFSVARIWKDGVATSLSNGTSNSSVNDFLISGTDIHSVGDDFIDGKVKAKYWKNGVGTTLSENGEAMCVFLSGTDVYVGGYEFTPDGKSTGVYWKNGQRFVLTGASSIWEGVANGNDIYFVGLRKVNSKPLAAYWKNGVATNLTDELHDSYAYGISVTGGNIYVSGGEKNESNHFVACYWKDGMKVPLTDGSSNQMAFYIAVSKSGDVYTSSQNEDGTTHTIWKNTARFINKDHALFAKITLVE